MNWRVMDSMKGIENAMTLAAVKRGEEILVLTDTQAEPEVAEALLAASRARGAEANLMLMPVLPRFGQEPPTMVSEAMKAADVVFIVLTVHFGHAAAMYDALAEGSRCLLMLNSLEPLAGPGAKFPMQVIFKLFELVFEQWYNGKTLHITCDRGSDLTAQIVKPQNVVGGPMSPIEPGTWEAFVGGTGDVGLWPGWTGDGILIFDGCEQAFPDEYPLKTPLKFTYKEGRVVKVEGGDRQVRFYEDLFTKHPDANHFGEIMVCLNPHSRTDQSIEEATRHAGCVHFAVGMGVDLYKDPRDRTTVKDPEVKPLDEKGNTLHFDNLMLTPTLTVDGEPCVENGRLVALDDAEVVALAHELGVPLE